MSSLTTSRCCIHHVCCGRGGGGRERGWEWQRKERGWSSLTLPSQASALVQQWCADRGEGELALLLHRKRVESKQEQLMNIEISTLLGFGLYEFTFADNDELEMTRRKLVRYVRVCVFEECSDSRQSTRCVCGVCSSVCLISSDR